MVMDPTMLVGLLRDGKVFDISSTMPRYQTPTFKIQNENIHKTYKLMQVSENLI